MINIIVWKLENQTIVLWILCTYFLHGLCRIEVCGPAIFFESRPKPRNYSQLVLPNFRNFLENGFWTMNYFGRRRQNQEKCFLKIVTPRELCSISIMVKFLNLGLLGWQSRTNPATWTQMSLLTVLIIQIEINASNFPLEI